MKYLLLFDIDGTLLTIPEKGMKIVSEALNHVFQREMELPHKSFSGQTDWQIFRETIHYHGISTADSLNAWEKFKEIYGSKFEEMITKDDVKIHAGACEIAAELSEKSDIHLGLLTGNIKLTAYKKLSMIGIDQHFSDGAFGDDHWKREWLGTIAVNRFSSQFVHREKNEVVIIGDTPRDIDVANYIGAVSVGVTNGKYSSDELKLHGADFITSDLQNLPDILNQIKS